MMEFLEEISAVAFMKEPQESVMKGAVLFGLKPTQIVRRIIPVTIGIESYEKKESEDSICEGEYIYFSYEDEITNENKKELGAIDISDFNINNRSLKVGMKFTNYINIIITDEIGNKENSVLLSYPVSKFI